MPKKTDILTIGGSTLDIMFSLPEAKVIKTKDALGEHNFFALEIGKKFVSQQVEYTSGGGAANAAVSLARLGFKSAVLSSIGKDASAEIILKNLEREKIDASLIQMHQDYTALSFVVSGGKKNEHVIFTHRSATALLEVSKKALQKANPQWIYLSSLHGKKWLKNLKNIFAYAKANNVKVAWNPGGRQLMEGYKKLKKYLAQTEVLILNRAEASDLVKSSGLKTDKLEKLFPVLAKWGSKIIVITCGEEGAYVCSAKSICFHQAISRQGVNTTGAGDAFGSSFIGGLMLYKNNIHKALRLAIIRSNYVVKQVGAQKGLLTLNEIKRKGYRI